MCIFIQIDYDTAAQSVLRAIVIFAG